MEAFIRSGASFHAQTKEPSTCEIECGVALDNTQRAQFVQYLQNVREGFAANSASHEIVQRLDIAYKIHLSKANSEIHQCRIFFRGPERLREEYMKKDLLHQVVSNPGSKRRLAIARETPLNREKISDDIVDVKLKLRYMITMKYWRIECIAIHGVDRKVPSEIVARRQIYYKNPIANIDEFIAFVSDPVYFFSSYRIEYELLDNTKIMTDMNAIIDEYNMIDKVIFGMEILALKYRECVRKVAAKYMHNPHECDTIKQVTPQARPFTYSDFRTTPLEGWFVSEKADGIHAVAYMDANETFLLESVLHIYRSGADTKDAIMGSAETYFTIADGEYISGESTPDGVPIFLIFDVMAIDGVDMTKSIFSERVSSIARAVDIFAAELAGKVKVLGKVFRPLPNPELDAPMGLKPRDDAPEWMSYRETILRTIRDAEGRPYANDGLIFVDPSKAYLGTTIYKWKQGELNTIDFLARSPSKSVDLRDKQPPKGLHPYLLYCSISSAQFGHLVHAMHYATMFDMNKFTTTKPVLFAPSIATDMNLLVSDRDDLDGRIVELSPIWIDERGQQIPSRTDTARLSWKFVRIRSDRDGDLRSGKYFGNYYTNAEQTLLAFIYPITLDMLLSNKGNEQYFVTDRGRIYEAAAKYNNAIKASLFEKYSHGVQYHLDLAGGRGSDINRYFEHIAQKVFVVEVDQSAIQELIGRKKNYLNQLDRPRDGAVAPLKRDKLPALVIIEQDLRRPYELILSKIRMFNPPCDGPQLLFDTASSHFAMHYFTRSDDEKINIARLVRMCLKPGGIFAFTMFDADRVRKLIAGAPWEFRLPDGRLKYRIERPDPTTDDIRLVLPFTGGELIGETLVNIGDIIEAFKREGFALVENVNFNDVYKDHLKQVARLDAGDKIFCGLYNYVVLRRA